MRALGYVRVSTQEQAHGGHGLDIQERAIRTWASNEPARLVAIESDAGVSGSTLEARDGLTRALTRLEAGDADVLVVYRLDRLARDLILQETTIARLEKRGVRVVSVTEADVDSEEPSRVFVRQVFGALAQYERAVIRSRMKAGQDAKRAAGGYYSGRPPYGWRAEDGRLVPVAEEQAVVREMLEARDGGISYAGIAERLNARGVRSKGGGEWHKWAVRQVVTRAS